MKRMRLSYSAYLLIRANLLAVIFVSASQAFSSSGSVSQSGTVQSSSPRSRSSASTSGPVTSSGAKAPLARPQATASVTDVLDSISTGDLAKVKAYKARGGDLNAQDKTGVTPLMQAAATGQSETAKYLIQQKVNLEIKNENGDTALAMAIGNEHDELAVDLMKAGAKLDVISTDDGGNLVFRATSVNSEKALAYLLKKDPAQVKAKNKEGDTALHEAAKYGTAHTILALLKSGADRSAKNAAGKTPHDIARELKNAEAEKLLK